MIKIEMPEYGGTEESLKERLGYAVESELNKYMLLDAWTAIGDTAYTMPDIYSSSGKSVIIIPDKINHDLHIKYGNKWKTLLPFKLIGERNLRAGAIYGENEFNRIQEHALPLIAELDKFDQCMEDMANEDESFDDEVDDIGLERGIYCIKNGKGEIVYIGSTMRTFSQRWLEHIQNFLQRSSSMALYSAPDWKDFTFEPLLNYWTLLFFIDGHTLTNRDIRMMEYALIQEHKPFYNMAGNTTKFRLDKKAKK